MARLLTPKKASAYQGKAPKEKKAVKVEVSTKSSYQPSPPAIVKPVAPLSVEAIAKAVKIARDLSGEDGARLRWSWHPLYSEAIAKLEAETRKMVTVTRYSKHGVSAKLMFLYLPALNGGVSRSF